MKKVSIKILGFIFAALILASCQKWINTDMNLNPDASVNVPISTILPAIQANMGYNTIGGTDLCRITSLWLQQLQGIERQSLATTDYILREGDLNNQWNTDFAGSMMDLVQMMQTARSEANPYALAVGQILMANSLGICTDVWNEIPYSNAFKGQGDMAPVFDTQEQIYGTIQALLDSAVTNLSQSGNWTIGGDMMYGGDPALWLKAAYAFKARYFLHLTKVDANSYANVLTVIDNAFTSNSDDLQFVYGTTQTFSNPLWQFMDQRGDISMNTFFIDMLSQRFDPRLTVYATTDANGGYSGNSWGGSSYDVSFPGSAVADMSSPTPFITYAECLFIKAEAIYGTTPGDETTIRSLISAGVAASMNKYGVLNPAYMAAYDSVLNLYSGAALFNELMTQKYIALYYQAEAFNDWRRTNIPNLTPNPSGEYPAGQSPAIPRRFPYSTDEINYNKNCPSYGTIWATVWWDTAK